MNQELANRISPQEPSEPLEQIFWRIDKINRLRSCHWSPHYLESYVRQLADGVEEQYINWLKAEGVKRDEGDFAQYLYLVLPWLSFRLLNSPGTKEVNIFKVSSGQKKRFIDIMIEELHELPDDPLLRAMMRESLNMLLSFLDSLRYRREQ
jgi:hypothetical protein